MPPQTNDPLRAALDSAQRTVNALIHECRSREWAAIDSRRQVAETDGGMREVHLRSGISQITITKPNDSQRIHQMDEQDKRWEPVPYAKNWLEGYHMAGRSRDPITVNLFFSSAETAIKKLLDLVEQQQVALDAAQAVIDSRKFTISTNESACGDELVRLRAENAELRQTIEAAENDFNVKLWYGDDPPSDGELPF